MYYEEEIYHFGLAGTVIIGCIVFKDEKHKTYKNKF